MGVQGQVTGDVNHQILSTAYSLKDLIMESVGSINGFSGPCHLHHLTLERVNSMSQSVSHIDLLFRSCCGTELSSVPSMVQYKAVSSKNAHLGSNVFRQVTDHDAYKEQFGSRTNLRGRQEFTRTKPDPSPATITCCAITKDGTYPVQHVRATSTSMPLPDQFRPYQRH